jgi:hypothetical protein
VIAFGARVVGPSCLLLALLWSAVDGALMAVVASLGARASAILGAGVALAPVAFFLAACIFGLCQKMRDGRLRRIALRRWLGEAGKTATSVLEDGQWSTIYEDPEFATRDPSARKCVWGVITYVCPDAGSWDREWCTFVSEEGQVRMYLRGSPEDYIVGRIVVVDALGPVHFPSSASQPVIRGVLKIRVEAR